jgi:putative salt-induced outer membrane protein YdiY
MSFRVCVRVTALMFVCAFVPAVPANAGQTPAPAAKSAPAAAPKLQWHGTLNGGLAVADGAQAQRGFQVGMNVKRPFSDHGSFVAQASHQYQRVTFPDDTTLTDRTAASTGIDADLTTRTILMARSMYLRDSVMYINSRFEQLIGYGLHLHDRTQRFEFKLVPGISVFQQDLAYSDVDGWEGGWGFYEEFSGKINAAWSVENAFRIRNNFKRKDHSVESNLALNGAITKQLGLQVEYQYNHESIVPPDYPKYLQVLSVGLRFKF